MNEMRKSTVKVYLPFELFIVYEPQRADLSIVFSRTQRSNWLLFYKGNGVVNFQRHIRFNL